MQLTRTHTFFASEHHQCNVVVKSDTEMDKLQSFPPPKTCDSCRKRFSESGIMALVGEVDWENVASSMFDPSTLVSLYFIQKAPRSILPLFIKDKTLIPLASALSTAIDEGTYNGHLKEVIGSLVNIVRFHGLCYTHDMKLTV